MNKKAAVELSMNFLVVLIISITVFSSGMFLFWKIYQSGEDQLGAVTSSVEEQIIRQLHSGSKVSIVPREISLNKKEDYTIGIGIKNMETSEQIFTVYVQRGLYLNSDGNTCDFATSTIGNGNCRSGSMQVPPLKLLGEGANVKVEPNKQEITKLMILSDRAAIAGEYVVNVCVCAITSGCSDFDTCKNGNSYDKNYPVSKVRVTIQ